MPNYYVPDSQRWHMYEIITKRNRQFANAFKKLRDPYSILQAYFAINKIVKEHFTGVQKADLWLRILLWVYNKEYRFFFLCDLQEVFNLTDTQATTATYGMLQRKLLKVDRTKRQHLFSLAPDAHLLLQTFAKESVSEIMKIVRENRRINERKKNIKKNENKVQHRG